MCAWVWGVCVVYVCVCVCVCMTEGEMQRATCACPRYKKGNQTQDACGSEHAESVQTPSAASFIWLFCQQHQWLYKITLFALNLSSSGHKPCCLSLHWWRTKNSWLIVITCMTLLTHYDVTHKDRQCPRSCVHDFQILISLIKTGSAQGHVFVTFKRRFLTNRIRNQALKRLLLCAFKKNCFVPSYQ